jgi:NitT/TauT family transport system substrate-binding protein
MKRATFLAASTAAATLIPGARARAADDTICFGTTAAETFALPLFAQELGFFKSAGLNVEITMFPGGAAVSAAVAGRALDIGATNTGTFANSHLRGIPFTIIAPGALYRSAEATTVLVVSKNSPLATAKDLNGKTIGVTTVHDLSQATVMKWADVNGGDSQSMKFIELTMAQMDAALGANRIDVSLLQEPQLTYAKDDIRRIAQPYDAIGSLFLLTAYFANSDWLAQNPAAAKKVAGALRQAAIWARGNAAATVPILEKYSKIPAAVLSQVARARHGETLEPALIQPVIDTMADYKFSPRRFPAAEVCWTPPKG